MLVVSCLTSDVRVLGKAYTAPINAAGGLVAILWGGALGGCEDGVRGDPKICPLASSLARVGFGGRANRVPLSGAAPAGGC